MLEPKLSLLGTALWSATGFLGATLFVAWFLLH